jgi:sugar lactone lactonase YvrE
MKKIIQFLMAGLFASTAFGQGIKFDSKELYPEGVAYSTAHKIFYVSSIHYGKIGKVDSKGNYIPFVDDAELVSTLGLLADNKRNLLYVCISDPGVSVKTNSSTQGKLAKLAAYDLVTGKRKFIADLGALNTGGGNFANDVTIDKEGNLYVTNSFSPVIFRVTQAGEASIFATSDLWKGEGFNLNGIVFHHDNFLLVDQSNTGTIYKVDLKDPKNITKVVSESLSGADGLILNGKNELIVISNSSQKAFQLITNDNWKTATTRNAVTTTMTFPTTGVFSNGNYFILNTKLNELFDPKATKTSDFILQQISFHK